MRPVWLLLLEGTPTAWRPAPTWTADSLAPAARDALAWLRRQGHAARLDSAIVDSVGRLYASSGAAVRVRALRLDVTPLALTPALREALAGTVGAAFSDSLVQRAAA